MYINEIDLLQWISESELNEAKRASESGDNKMNIAILFAQQRIKDKINYRYDMTAEFVRTGNMRNLTLVKICCDIAIWYMAQALELNDMDGKYYQSFEQAEKDLMKIESGNMAKDLPTYDSTDANEESPVKYGVTKNIFDETY